MQYAGVTVILGAIAPIPDGQEYSLLDVYRNGLSFAG
jgi:hypothetical protein